MATNLKLALLVSTDGSTKKTVAELIEIQKATKKIADEADGISKLAQSLGVSYKEAQKLSESLGLSAEKTDAAIGALKQLNAVSADTETKLAVLASKLGLTAEQTSKIDKELQNYKGSISGINEQTSLLGGGVAELAFKFNNVVTAVQSLLAAAKPAYDFLIGSNEQLNEQILRSQTGLASATRIFQGGQEITDPTARIQATRGEIEAALKQIERDTEFLVGVTSEQVNSFFDATLSNATELIGQSKKFADPIKSATALTTGFAAAFKVVGLSADQVTSEIRALLTGSEIDNSTIAKTLNLTREQIQQFKQQGVLVDELNKRLEVFVAGNQIAANSISGVSSNLLDLFQRLGRSVGQPLLDPIVKALDEIFKFLKANEAEILNFFKSLVEIGGNTARELAQNFKVGDIIKTLIDFVKVGAPLVRDFFSLLATGAVNASSLINSSDLLNVLGQIITKATDGLAKLAELARLRQFNDGAEAVNILSQRTQELTDQASRAAVTLRQLNDQRAKGIPLTQQQQDLEKALKLSAKDLIPSIDAQIQAYKELTDLAPETERARQAEIANLERLKATLSNTSGGLKIQGKEAKELGDAYAQLKRRSEGAQQVIDQGFDSPQLQQAFKDRLETTQQLLEIGRLDTAEAVKRLSAIANNSKAEVDTQLKAKQSIIKARKDQIDIEIETIQAGQAEIEALQAAGNLKEAEADRQLTDLKLAEIQKRIDAARVVQEQGSGAERERAIVEEKKLQAELSKTRAEFNKREQQRRLDEILEASEKAQAAISQAQTARLIAERQAEVAALRQNGVDREQVERETEQRIAAIQQDGITKELRNRQDALNKIRAARAAKTIDDEKAADQERKLVTEIGQLTLQSIDAEKAALASLRQQKIRQIELDLQRSRSSLDLRSQQLQLENVLLGQQNNLISARQGLEQALTNLQNQRLQFALEDAKAAGDSTRAQQIQQEIFAAQRDQLEQQYQFKLQNLELTEKQKKNELEIAQVQAMLAKLDAEAAVRKAIAEGKSQEEIAALQQIVGLRQRALDLANQAISNQDKINRKQREQIGIEQTAARERLQREQQKQAASGSGSPSGSGGGGGRNAIDARTIGSGGRVSDPGRSVTVDLVGQDISRYNEASKQFERVLKSTKDQSGQIAQFAELLTGGILNDREKDFLAFQIANLTDYGKELVSITEQLRKQDVSGFTVDRVAGDAARDGKNVIEALKGLVQGLNGASDSLSRLQLTSGLASSNLGGIPQIKARKDGGGVVAGQPYLVGEVGPELITPSRNGFVWTAAQTSNLLAGGIPSLAMTRGAISSQISKPTSVGDKALLQEMQGLRGEVKQVAEQAAYPRTLVVGEGTPPSTAAQVWSELSKQKMRRSKL